MTTMTEPMEPFAATLHKSEEWLRTLADSVGGDEHKAYRMMRATLHALRDRLTVEESAHLSAQFPMLIRGLYYEGFTPSRVPCRDRTLDEFLTHVSKELQLPCDPSPQESARRVFALLQLHITRGALEKVRNSLPQELRSLWPAV